MPVPRIPILLAFSAATAPFLFAQAGISSEWDTRGVVSSLQAQASHLRPILLEVDPQSWIAKGAPEAYAGQWKSSQNQLNLLLNATDALSRQPERLTLALDALFRMETLEHTLGSLMEGIRKYQDPALASRVQAALNENSINRMKLREYCSDLAKEKEQEFQIADHEAQRCRGILAAPSSGSGQRSRRTEAR